MNTTKPLKRVLVKNIVRKYLYWKTVHAVVVRMFSGSLNIQVTMLIKNPNSQ